MSQVPETGFAIDAKTKTVILSGKSLISDLVGGLKADTYKKFSGIALAMVKLHGQEYGITEPGVYSDWCLGAASEEDLEFLLSHLTPEERKRDNSVSFVADKDIAPIQK